MIIKFDEWELEEKNYKDYLENLEEGETPLNEEEFWEAFGEMYFNDYLKYSLKPILDEYGSFYYAEDGEYCGYYNADKEDGINDFIRDIGVGYYSVAFEIDTDNIITEAEVDDMELVEQLYIYLASILKYKLKDFKRGCDLIECGLYNDYDYYEKISPKLLEMKQDPNYMNIISEADEATKAIAYLYFEREIAGANI